MVSEARSRLSKVATYKSWLALGKGNPKGVPFSLAVKEPPVQYPLAVPLCGQEAHDDKCCVVSVVCPYCGSTELVEAGI